VKDDVSPEGILQMLRATPDRLGQVTRGIAPDRLRATPVAGEWSANEVLAHLRSCADVWGEAIATIVTEDTPTIRAINPRTWIKRTNYVDLEFRPSLRAFASQRADLLAMLEPLRPEAWTRRATVTGAGKVLERTVLVYARWLGRHERPHLKQVESIVASVRG
jgi:hypothetical protein